MWSDWLVFCDCGFSLSALWCPLTDYHLTGVSLWTWGISSHDVYPECIMWTPRLDKAQSGIKISQRNINHLRYADNTTLKAESKEELKSLLMKVKEDSEKHWLNTQHSKNEGHGIQCHHFMANRWVNNGNSDRLYFLGLQKSLQIVTAAKKLKDTCSLGKTLTNLDNILKSRGITLLYSQSYGFSSSHMTIGP